MLVAMRAARNCRERPQKPGERERERAGAGISGWRLGGQGVARSGGRRLQGLTSTDILRCGAEAARWSPGHQYTPRERRLPCINILSPQIDLLASVEAGYIRRREEYCILAIVSHSSLSSVPFWIQNPNTVSIAYFIVQQNLQSSHLPDAVTNQLHYILRCVKLDYSVFTVHSAAFSTISV